MTLQDSRATSANPSWLNDTALSSPLQLWLSCVIFSCFTLGLTCSKPAIAVPPKSITALEQGLAQVHEEAPWISGWDLDGHARNLRQILKLKRDEMRAVYVTLCHTQSDACIELLRFLESVRGILESEGVDILLVFAEDISVGDLNAWLELRGLRLSASFQVLIDRFHRSALRLGAYQSAESKSALVKSNLNITSFDGVGDHKKGEDKGGSKSSIHSQQVLRVPLSLLVSREGRVMTIILQTGADITEQISSALRYLEVE